MGDVKVGVAVEGLNDLVKSFKWAGVSANDLKDVFGPISDQVAQEAKLYAPAKTGRMRASIKGTRRQNQASVTVNVPGQFYHRFIWFGSPTTGKPNPFTLKALQRMTQTGEITQLMDAGITRLLKRAGLL